MRGANDDFRSLLGSAPRKLSRRALLEAGAVGLVLGGAAVATLRTRGYTLPASRTLSALAPWQFVVVQHAARRIVAPDRQDAAIPGADDLDVAGFVDGWVSRLPQRMRRDLGRFLAYVEHVAPLGARFASRFTRLAASGQDEVLWSLASSSSDLLRAGFDGLRSLVFLGYYRDARTWKAIGYDGPLVGRPPGGW
ncbi:MAG: gluconate 2-dehydrogenase subunit 3 family protein [Myxococcota bacterium]|nr:gluconate 2-dehydrogenase subunit 3 family protein [Myxococcota bacterium]